VINDDAARAALEKLFAAQSFGSKGRREGLINARAARMRAAEIIIYGNSSLAVPARGTRSALFYISVLISERG